MTLTNRSTLCRHLAATLGLTILTAAISHAAGQESLLKSVNDALAEVNATKAQLGETMKSLNALQAVKPGNDLRPEYQAYVHNVDQTKQAAAMTKHRVEQMNADSANYFSSWKADNEKIVNDQVRKMSTQRLEQAQAEYASSVANLSSAATKFSPFLSDLNDIQIALSNDLTAKGINAARGVFAKANTDHAEVEKDIDMAIQHLTASREALAPIAGD